MQEVLFVKTGFTVSIVLAGTDDPFCKLQQLTPTFELRILKATLIRI